MLDIEALKTFFAIKTLVAISMDNCKNHKKQTSAKNMVKYKTGRSLIENITNI